MIKKAELDIIRKNLMDDTAYYYGDFSTTLIEKLIRDRRFVGQGKDEPKYARKYAVQNNEMDHLLVSLHVANKPDAAFHARRATKS